MLKANCFNGLFLSLLIAPTSITAQTGPLLGELISQQRQIQASKLPSAEKGVVPAKRIDVPYPRLWSITGHGSNLRADLLLDSTLVTVTKTQLNQPIDLFWRLTALDSQGVTLTFINPESDEVRSLLNIIPSEDLRLSAPAPGTPVRSLLQKK